jgi:hypothetical protein
LTTNEWFYQDPASGTNIYWISIAAIYYQGPNVPYPFGWKTRPRDLNSLAPDDAVRFYFPVGPYYPIWWPEPTNSWDMAFVLTTQATEDQDFGDAPDPTYPTLLSSTGARHFILPGFNLGLLIDAEINGQPNSTATGDDTTGLADEDGVSFASPLLVGTLASVNVSLTSFTGTGKLDAWVDFNKNGAWEPAEKVFNNLTLLSGVNNLSFNVPSNAGVGPTFARFRLSSGGGLLPTGAAADGEVEDYRITLMQRGPVLTNIVITNFVTTASNATVWWNAQQNIHYWLLGTTNLNIWMTNWPWISPEVIGPISSQTENYYYRCPTNRFYRVVAPYVWP